MADHLDSKNLIPFSRRHNGFQLPGAKRDRDDEMLEQIDPDLSAEDEGVIRRYLHYADTLLGGPETEGLTLVPDGGPAKRLAAVPEKSAPLDQTRDNDESEAEDQNGSSNQVA
jgi:hypothetical protein